MNERRGFSQGRIEVFLFYDEKMDKKGRFSLTKMEREEGLVKRTHPSHLFSKASGG